MESTHQTTDDKIKTILLVEDDLALQKAIWKKLERCGFRVAAVRSVKDAHAFLEVPQAVDAIWLDHYLLGKESGLDLVSNLKSTESRWKHIPIFVVSNTASPEKMQTYLNLGIDRFYTKTNYRLEEIISDIQQFLGIPQHCSDDVCQ